MGHSPVCHNYKSEKGCIHGKKCFFRHVDAEDKVQQKGKIKVVAKGLCCNIEGVVFLKIFYPRQSIQRKSGKLGSKTHRQILRRHLAPNSNSGKKGSIARNHPKGVHLNCVGPRASKFERRSHGEDFCTKKDAPAEQRGIRREIFTMVKNSDKAFVLHSN